MKPNLSRVLSYLLSYFSFLPASALTVHGGHKFVLLSFANLVPWSTLKQYEVGLIERGSPQGGSGLVGQWWEWGRWKFWSCGTFSNQHTWLLVVYNPDPIPSFMNEGFHLLASVQASSPAAAWFHCNHWQYIRFSAGLMSARHVLAYTVRKATKKVSISHSGLSQLSFRSRTSKPFAPTRQSRRHLRSWTQSDWITEQKACGSLMYACAR